MRITFWLIIYKLIHNAVSLILVNMVGAAHFIRHFACKNAEHDFFLYGLEFLSLPLNLLKLPD